MLTVVNKNKRRKNNDVKINSDTERQEKLAMV